MFEDLPEFVLWNSDPTFSGSIIPSKRSDRIGSFVLSFIPPRNALENEGKKWLCFLSLDTERKAGVVTWLSLGCVGICRCCRVSRDVLMFCFCFAFFVLLCHRSCQRDSRLHPFTQVETFDAKYLWHIRRHTRTDVNVLFSVPAGMTKRNFENSRSWKLDECVYVYHDSLFV